MTGPDTAGTGVMSVQRLGKQSKHVRVRTVEDTGTWNDVGRVVPSQST